MSTGIEWTDETWNPVTGCDKVSPGCDHCYAETIAHRFAGTKAFPDGFKVTLHPERLDQPLRWRKPRKVFVNSMSDLFHKDIPDEFVARVFAVMAQASRHQFQVLTKRPGVMRSLLTKWTPVTGAPPWTFTGPWPIPNVWLGTSIESDKYCWRADVLRETPAAVRFLSLEPLLGPLRNLDLTGIDWVIVGGESGRNARPMHPAWARSIRDQCNEAHVPFLFKQRGEWTWNEPGQFSMPSKPYGDRVAVMHPAGMTALTKSNPFDPFERGHPNWATRIERVGKGRSGRLLDGRTWDEYPEVSA